VGAETVSGNVEISAPTPEAVAKSVSGNVTITGASGRIAASTVSGHVQARSGRLQYGAFESVSGTLAFDGQIQDDAALSFVSHSGNVHLGLPSGVSARFEVNTFSGSIRNELGPSAQRINRYGPGQELRFTSGGGGALVRIKSFSGAVTLDER
jgi:DUF4097 and DUF4098 domain-containing protein YvlB